MGNFILNIKNLINKVKNKFNFKQEVEEEVKYTNEKFNKYLENIDILDPSYDNIKQAIDSCQESIYLAERRIIISNKLQDFFVREKDLDIFNNFQKEDLNKLQNYIDAYRTVSKEKDTLKNQVNSYDKVLDYLSKCEDTAEAVIVEMEYYEKRQAGLKRDMAYIQGEKEELIYSKEQLEQAIDFLYKFSIILVCGLTVVTFTLGVLKITNNVEVFIPFTILAVLAIVLGSIIYIFQRKFKYELHRNTLLQVRAVELLNRAKVLYVNCTGFLNYEYKKYRVRNSVMLKNNWDEYIYQKQIAKRHIAMNNRMQEVVDNINKILTNKGIQDSQDLFEQLLNLVSLEDKKLLYKDVKSEKQKLEKELEDLDIKQEKLWGLLMSLKEKDITDDNIISRIIQSCEEEVKNLIIRIEEKNIVES